MKVNTNPTADVKDLIANSASWRATLAKDIQNRKVHFKRSGALCSNQISDMWAESMEAFTKKAFRGDDDSIEYIGDLIAEGKFNNQKSVDMADIRKQLRKVFFAIMIPEAWKVGAGYAPAFVMDSGYGCNDVGPLDYEYIAPSTGEEMGYCHEGRRYYLLAPNGPQKDYSIPVPGPSPGSGPGGCTDNCFTAPQGMDNLDPEEQGDYDWGGITKEDLIFGAVEGWKANKEKNGGGFLDLTKASSYDFLLEKDPEEVNIRLPGFIQIPVCSPERARGGWKAFDSLSSIQKQNQAQAEQVWQYKPWVRKYLCGRGGFTSMESTPFWIAGFYGSWNTDTERGTAHLEMDILAVHNASLMSCQDIDVSSLRNSIDFQVLGRSVGRLEEFESKCPLPVTDALTPIGKTLFNSYHLVYTFNSTHQFQTLESTFRFTQIDGQELDCGRAKITPEFGNEISAPLTFVPFCILIFITLSSWLVNYGGSQPIHTFDFCSVWPVVLDMTNYLRYLQFAFIAASMTIGYPGFFVPAVSKLSWASLLYWAGPFHNWHMYEGPNGGMYTSNGSYGLDMMTQMLRYPNMLDTLANSLINLILLVAPLFFLLSLVLWTLSRSSSVHSLPLLSIVQKAAWTTIGVALCFFSVPLLSYISHDLILTGFLPNYRIGLAVVMILVILGAGHFLVQVLEDDPASGQLKTRRVSRVETGQHNVDFHLIWRVLSRHMPHTMPLLQAIGVGGLQDFPIAQLFMFIACEAIIMVSLLTSKERGRVRTPIAIYLSAMRLLILVLISIFVMPMTEATKQWVGYVVLGLHGLAIFTAFLLTHVWKLYETVFKSDAADQDSSTNSVSGESNLVNSFDMNSLDERSTTDLLDYRQAPSREPSKRDFQPDPSTFYRPPRSGATSPVQAPQPSAASTVSRPSVATTGSPGEGPFSIDLALSEVAVGPGVDYSFRESDRFYGVAEERIFSPSVLNSHSASYPGSPSGGGRENTGGSHLQNKLVTGLKDTFGKPKPKIQEKGFQVKRPPRPP
ncbi:hypothetical protein FBEOM_11882 [Fusarium beomiforme]|uniref:TRP C-terminal domain-containing protein n=1 Tax=Fusarium beomiforme TaxID=44412 RepID=A0A9P5AA91_9HYPO|nr:hypothetical protein FBEOM_11882 [Fusarium beomiforme]